MTALVVLIVFAVAATAGVETGLGQASLLSGVLAVLFLMGSAKAGPAASVPTVGVLALLAAGILAVQHLAPATIAVVVSTAGVVGTAMLVRRRGPSWSGVRAAGPMVVAFGTAFSRGRDVELVALVGAVLIALAVGLVAAAIPRTTRAEGTDPSESALPVLPLAAGFALSATVVTSLPEHPLDTTLLVTTVAVLQNANGARVARDRVAGALAGALLVAAAAPWIPGTVAAAVAMAALFAAVVVMERIPFVYSAAMVVVTAAFDRGTWSDSPTSTAALYLGAVAIAGAIAWAVTTTPLRRTR